MEHDMELMEYLLTPETRFALLAKINEMKALVAEE